MYRPPGLFTKWVPLKSFSWRIIYCAERDGIVWDIVDDTSTSNGDHKNWEDESIHPEWSSLETAEVTTGVTCPTTNLC